MKLPAAISSSHERISSCETARGSDRASDTATISAAVSSTSSSGSGSERAASIIVQIIFTFSLIVEFRVGDSGGMCLTDISNSTGLSRTSFYKSLSANGHPRKQATVLKVVRALGLRLTTTPARRLNKIILSVKFG